MIDARGTDVAESVEFGRHRAVAWHAALAALVATGHVVRKGTWYEASGTIPRARPAPRGATRARRSRGVRR